MSAERWPPGKECSKCGEWRLYEEYHRESRALDGYRSSCAVCSNQYQYEYRKINQEAVQERDRRMYEVNREHIRELRRRRYTKNLEQREKQRAYLRWYWVSNQEKLKEKQRQYYDANKEQVKQRVKEYRKSNPEKRLEMHHRRRARKLSAQGKFTFKQFAELCEFYGNVCLCCGGEKKLTADHVIPLSKGGSNDISNIQPLCQPCNARKYTKTTDYRPLFDKDTEELGETG